MKNKKAFYQLQDQEWFDANAYKDLDGDYWRSDADLAEFDDNNDEHQYSNQYLVFDANINRLMSQEAYIQESKESKFDWAIKKIFTFEEYPEMFL
jgi:hypothetical protein